MPIFLISLTNGIDSPFYEGIYIFLVSLIANTFSSLSGGGAGLIQLPALILSGIPYYQALATHKFATVALGMGGSIRNYKSLSKDFLIIREILLYGIPGVLFGTSIVSFISAEYLYFILGLFSISLAFYSFNKSELGLLSVDKKPNFSEKFRFIIFIFLIGTLNGSISSGTGLLVTILLIKTLGLDFLRAISITFFTVGIFWNAAGAFSLSRIGYVPLDLLLLLTLGSFIGGFLGAHLSNLKGNKLIKKTFSIVCFLVGITLLVKSINTLLSLN